MESDCFENGLKFPWDLSGGRYCVSSVKTSLQKLTSGSFSLLTKLSSVEKGTNDKDSKQVLGAIFSSYSRQHCFHSTTKREANLTFSVFTPDNNPTIIQISNLIFPLTQMLYLLPEVFSVFKFLPGEILIYKYVGAFQLSAIFQDILFVFKI